MNRILGELQSRVRLQAVVLTISPGKPPSSNTFQVYGASPLNGVIKNHQDRIVQELESHLKKVELTATVPQDSTDDQVQRLPSLVIDGIPTPLNKMTNWQLRKFIPQMLKCSEGRPRPGWGKDHMKPVWWPDDVPWKNVRHADMRSDSEKELKSFRDVLRSIVRNCYKHHNEMDLLLEMGDLNDNGKAGSASSPEVGSELGMPDLPQIPDPPEQTEQVTLDSTHHPKLIENIQAADHELAMPDLLQQPPDPAEQMQQVFLNLTQHPELIQNIQAADHELGMPDFSQIPDPSEQTEQVTLDLTQHPELIQHIQAADHELGMPDLPQIPDPSEQTEQVTLDLTQHPELIQHIQATDHELGMPDLPQIPDPSEQTEQVTLDLTQHPELIQNVQAADHELGMPDLPQIPDPSEQTEQVTLDLTQHPELIQNIQAADHELGMPDLPQIPDPSEQTEQVTLDLTQHPELIQNVQAADHELGMPDLLQPPDPAEQMQKVFLDLTQHPELMQHIQAAISSRMLSPQYLESTQLVPASLIKPGSVSTEAQVALSAAVSSHQSSATIAGVGSADDTDGLSNHGAPACEMDEEPDAIHLQAWDDNMQ